MKFSIIVEARLSSSRLKNKILMKIKKYTFLEFLIRRLKLVESKNEIIIATTDNEKNDEIINIAKKLNVKYFRGSQENVIKRVLDASKKYKCNYIVRITSDCPVIDPKIIDLVIENFKNNNCDYLSNSNIRSYPDGMDVEVFKYETLLKSYKYAKTNKDKEFTTLSIRKNSKYFKIINLIAPKELYWPSLGLTLDEFDDYKFLRKIILSFKEKTSFTCMDILNLLKKNKKWLYINKNVKRNV